jgi:hypothetical protein
MKVVLSNLFEKDYGTNRKIRSRGTLVSTEWSCSGRRGRVKECRSLPTESGRQQAQVGTCQIYAFQDIEISLASRVELGELLRWHVMPLLGAALGVWRGQRGGVGVQGPGKLRKFISSSSPVPLAGSGATHRETSCF